MRKASPKVRLYLARQALERYYRDDGLSEEQKDWMNKLYGDNPDSKSIKKLQMRLLSRECCEIIVGAVIAEASHEEKIFLRDKYKLRRNFTAISCRKVLLSISRKKFTVLLRAIKFRKRLAKGTS